jgi:hypothetical protein
VTPSVVPGARFVLGETLIVPGAVTGVSGSENAPSACVPASSCAPVGANPSAQMISFPKSIEPPEPIPEVDIWPQFWPPSTVAQTPSAVPTIARFGPKLPPTPGVRKNASFACAPGSVVPVPSTLTQFAPPSVDS